MSERTKTSILKAAFMKRRTPNSDPRVNGFERVVGISRRKASETVLTSALSASVIGTTTRSRRGANGHALRSRMLKVVPARCDVSAAVVQLADDLLSASTPTAHAALDSLDRMRRTLGAIEARVWVFDGAQPRCVLRAGGDAESGAEPLA